MKRSEDEMRTSEVELTNMTASVVSTYTPGGLRLKGVLALGTMNH